MARCLAANKLPLILARSKRLYRFKVFLDPRRACLSSSVSAGGEAEEHFMFSFFPFFFFFHFFWRVGAGIQPSSPSGTSDSLRPSHLDLGGLFFCSAVLTSLFNSADSSFARLGSERVGGRETEVHLNVYPCCDAALRLVSGAPERRIN